MTHYVGRVLDIQGPTGDTGSLALIFEDGRLAYTHTLEVRGVGSPDLLKGQIITCTLDGNGFAYDLVLSGQRRLVEPPERSSAE